MKDFWQYKFQRPLFITLSVVATLFFAMLLTYLQVSALVLILILAVSVPLVVLLFKHQTWGLKLTLLAVVPGNLWRFSLGTQEQGGAAILLTDLALPLIILVWLFTKITAQRDLRRNSINLPLLIFTLVALASLLQGFNILNTTGLLTLKETIVSSMYWLRWVEYAFVFFIAADVLKSKTELKSLLSFLLWTGVLVAIGGFVQLIVMPDFTEYAILYGWDPHQGRLLGTFFDPNFIATFFAVLECVALSLLLESKNWPERLTLLLQILTMGVALVLTFSRTGYLAMLIGLFVIGLLRAPKVVFASLLIFTLALSSSPRALNRITEGLSFDETAMKRVESWTKALRLIPNWPILGVGYNTLMYVQEDLGTADAFDVNNRSGVENSFLTVLLTTGFLGLLAFLGMYLGIVKQCYLNMRNKVLTADLQVLSVGILAAILAFLVSSITLNSLFYPFLLVPIWILAGSAAALPYLKHGRTEEPKN